jgi:hypothetical protein
LKLYRLLPTLLLLLPISFGYDLTALRLSLLASLNQERAAAGRAPLRLDDTLNQVAQRSAEEIRDRNAGPPRPEDIREIRLRLVRTGYEAHGWSQSFVVTAGDEASVISWWKEQNDATFRDPDYRDLGIGVTDLGPPLNTPLYTFLFASSSPGRKASTSHGRPHRSRTWRGCEPGCWPRSTRGGRRRAALPWPSIHGSTRRRRGTPKTC